VPYLRFLDVSLVLASAPLVLLSGLPRLGYAAGAGAWLLTRAGSALLQARARRAGSLASRTGLQLAAMMSRVWVVAGAVLLARYAAGRDDGIMAAALVLVAFTVYFATSLATRGGTLRAGARPQGRPSSP
jgi:hypothetical protein